MTDFAAQVEAWALNTEKRIDACFKSSAQDLFYTMIEPVSTGGNLPFKTGFLRGSARASTQAMPTIDPDAKPKEGGVYGVAPDTVLTIANADLNDTIYMGFTAAYARRVNYGFVGTDSLGRVYGQWGANFVGLAQQQWQRIVDDNAKKAIAAFP